MRICVNLIKQNTRLYLFEKSSIYKEHMSVFGDKNMYK